MNQDFNFKFKTLTTHYLNLYIKSRSTKQNH